MWNFVKDRLKAVPFLVQLKQRISRSIENRKTTKINVLHTFPLYVPNSAGKYNARARLTLQSINQVFPVLAQFADSLGSRVLKLEQPSAVFGTPEDLASAEELKKLLDTYGSDKAVRHNYHYLYGPLLLDRENIQNICEIGLGTNNTDVVSHMGDKGQPGASLRAFKEYCPNANIYGADVDRRILFQEERIRTFYVDQTDVSSLEQLKIKFQQKNLKFDLVIDDGLHSPDANVATLQFGLEIVKKGGWVVIEDIHIKAFYFWQLVAAILPDKYRAHLFKPSNPNAIVFAVERLT